MITRFNKGDRSMMVEPFDYLLIMDLPAEGTNVAGLYQVGEPVSELVKKYQAAEMTPDAISSRLRTMQNLGLTRMVRMAGGRSKRAGTAWQQTTKGKEVAEAWLKAHPQ